MDQKFLNEKGSESFAAFIKNLKGAYLYSESDGTVIFSAEKPRQLWQVSFIPLELATPQKVVFRSPYQKFLCARKI